MQRVCGFEMVGGVGLGPSMAETRGFFTRYRIIKITVDAEHCHRICRSFLYLSSFMKPLSGLARY